MSIAELVWERAFAFGSLLLLTRNFLITERRSILMFSPWFIPRVRVQRLKASRPFFFFFFLYYNGLLFGSRCNSSALTSAAAILSVASLPRYLGTDPKSYILLIYSLRQSSGKLRTAGPSARGKLIGRWDGGRAGLIMNQSFSGGSRSMDSFQLRNTSGSWRLPNVVKEIIFF